MVYCQETSPSRDNQRHRSRIQHTLSSRSGSNIFPGNLSAFIIPVVQLRPSPLQIARGLVLPLTIAISPARFHPQQATRVTLAAGLVTIGFFVGVIPEGNLPVSSIPSPRSLVFGVFSSLSIAIHSVLVKSSLSYCENSTIQLAYWTNAVSAILLAPFVFLRGEHVKIVELSVSSEWNMNVFIVGSLVTGTFGFLLCVAGLLSIKVTSPITHMFSSVRSHPSHFSCHDIHYSSLGCSLRHSNAFGGLDISRRVDLVRHPFSLRHQSLLTLRYIAVIARCPLGLFLAVQCRSPSMTRRALLIALFQVLHVGQGNGTGAGPATCTTG